MKDDQATLQSAVIESNEHLKQEQPKDLPFEDDRYPGSFFKVPGAPISNKTAWRLS